MCCLSERTDEDEIDLGRQLGDQVLKARITDEGNIMTLFPAPHTDHLGHDAGKIGIHHAPIQSLRRTPRNNIYDPNMELSHAVTGPGNFIPSLISCPTQFLTLVVTGMLGAA